MNQDTFVSKHEATWQSFEKWLAAQEAGSRKKTTTMEQDHADIPHLYRQICHHLALARDRRYSAHLVDRLNNLVLQGHQRLYQVRRIGLYRFGQFLFVDFPRSVRREWRLVLLAGLLFYGSLIGMFVAVQANPEIVYSLMSPEEVVQFEIMYSPTTEKLGRQLWKRGSDDDFLMFGVYIKNNIGIGFQTFASGLLFGLGSIFYLLFNGLYIGTIAGHLTQVGSATPFFSFVSGHSALELTAIVLAGTAGIRLGLALLKPGRRSRVRALREAGVQSLPLVYGLALMLVGAAFIEAFWSSMADIDPQIKYSVGIVFWILTLLYFLFAGIGHED